jgi:uncharacterized phage protein (TIGR02220 family)
MKGGAQMEQPNYYAIIPANIRYDKKITPGAKLLYGEITALSNKKGFCWAKDQYFMNLYNVGQTTVQRWLHSLESGGYIKRSVQYKEGTKEIENRYIRIRAYPIPENGHTPMPKNGQENSTSIINNTRVNKNHSPVSTGQHPSIDYSGIIGYLNQKSGKHFRDTAATRKLISARLNDGHFTEASVRQAIDNVVSSWSGDPKMDKYVRPTTIFKQSKFEDYVSAPPYNSRRKQTQEDGESYGGIVF